MSSQSDHPGRIVVSVREVRSETALHQLLAEWLTLPDYYGHNWDTFEECVHDEDLELPAEVIIQGWDELNCRLPDDAKILRDIAESADHPPCVTIRIE